MSGVLATITAAGTKTANVVRAVGPFMLSQVDTASEKYAQHQARLAHVEIGKELLKAEIDTRKQVRLALLQKLPDASPEEVLEIQRKLEFLDQTTRVVGVAAKALDYTTPKALPESGSATDGNVERAAPETGVPEITPHWLDHFNDLARKRNEDWREELLARALAREAENPGTISPRALWLLGNIERLVFEQLSSLLNLCFWTAHSNQPFLPDQPWSLYKISIDDGGERTVGNIVFSLQDVGILSDPRSTSRSFRSESNLVVRYGERFVLLALRKPLKIGGIMFTPLGNSVAQFFQPTPTEQGKRLFSQWLASLPEDLTACSELTKLHEGAFAAKPPEESDQTS